MLNRTFNELKLEQHSDKALIGRIERGFEFLGYFFNPSRLKAAYSAIIRFASGFNGCNLVEV